MDTMPSAPQWLFDPFRLDPTNACLWCDDTPVALPPKAFDVLYYLVTHPDRLVTKDELLDAVWPETTVTDAVLRVAIGTLRKVLGDTAQTPRFIATVLGRGYRFVASIEASPGMASGPAGSVLPAAPQTPRVRPAVVAAPPPEASTRDCPRCQYPNPATAQFCIACATPLALRCTACGQANLPDAAFCQACATSLPSTLSLPVAPLPGTSEAPSQQSLASSSDAVSSPEAERRRLTVLFCDLVDSTSLAAHLDPEDLRDVVHAYHRTCVEVIHRFDGYIAQYLGDGILVYFGSPVAHEDDAQRAVWTGLGILEALEALTPRLELHSGNRLAVRLGIHTGLAVVGDVGEGSRHERLALGETPNIAARLQHLAVPNTLLISAATYQLIAGYFTCAALGEQPLHGLAQPLQVYQVLRASGVQSRLEVAASRGLTPLVGREPEVGLLLERWARVKAGMGQVVLLSGEAGIGKSRLVHMLKDQVATESQAWLTPCQCSPYHHNTALYPLIDLLERVTLRFDREESQQQKLRKLEGLLVQHGLNLAEAVPLLAALLSLPLSADYAPLTMSPEQQKQQTLHTLLTILLRMAAQQPVLFVMEDLHWVDPSTLEFLSFLVDQGPTARILALFTCRPDFSPPWTGRAHLTQVTLPRLTRRQAAEMADWMAHHKALPPEVVEQVVTKTDGVPLFVEELTKMVLESGLLQEREHSYELSGPLPPLAIPTTLHDSLMARLDRLGTVKGLAQLGATLGHEFSYALLQAVSPWDEGTLQHGLHQLVQAEFVYQQGLPPQATYLFKHALIQDAAYQSLLRRTRQQHHQRIAQVLEAQFPEIVAIQPELLAHHYTEAGLSRQAIVYWYKSGQRAIQRSSNIEAAGHLTKGLAVLPTLPDTLERTQHELRLQLALGAVFIATKGYAASEVENVDIRAQTLCQALGEMSRLPQVLLGLEAYYVVKAQLRRAHELAEQCLALAQRLQHPVRLLHSHHALGGILFHLGEAAAAPPPPRTGHHPLRCPAAPSPP
jgi:class 3 adenylate cyclase/DNA-binding winged helix-turn-helix (wHTH) protein